MAQGKVGLGEARMVRVWNRGSMLFDYMVQGDRVTIPVGGFVEVPRQKANNIQGFYPGKSVPVHIDLEPILPEKPEASKPEAKTDEPDKVKIYVCSHCDFETTKKIALINHMKTHNKVKAEAANDTGAVGN